MIYSTYQKLLSCLPTSYNPLTWGHPNFYMVEEGKLYRSKTLSGKQLEKIVGIHGIRSFLIVRSLQPAALWYRHESTLAEKKGITIFHVPLKAHAVPTQAELSTLQGIFETHQGPLLIHCRAGADRTGFVCALWKLYKQETLEQALAQQRLQYGHMAWRYPHLRNTIMHLHHLREVHGSLRQALMHYSLPKQTHQE